MIDVAIVGGGAAGIAAALKARARGLSSVILEASDRIGGRAHTVEWRGRALDLGATWLHSADRNPLVPLAERNGFAIDRTRAPWRKQFQNLGFSEEEQAESWAASEAFEERLRANPPPTDRAGDALDPHCEWNGFLDAISGFLNGAGLRQVSAADYVAYWEAAGDSNWRLPQGYGVLVSALATGLDVRTGCPVRRIEHSPAGVRLVTNQGTTEASHAVVAVPTSVLASGEIAFEPCLDDWLQAATQLPLGHVEKLFLTLESERIPDDSHLIGDPRRADTGSYMLRPMGMPIVEAFFGGDWVKGLGADDLAARAREELGHLLGTDFARSLEPVAFSDWQRRAFICGSYSFAWPGRHGARAALAAPVDGRLAFAGEACSDVDFATVHGAWQSGLAAVEQLFGKTKEGPR